MYQPVCSMVTHSYWKKIFKWEQNVEGCALLPAPSPLMWLSVQITC